MNKRSDWVSVFAAEVDAEDDIGLEEGPASG